MCQLDTFYLLYVNQKKIIRHHYIICSNINNNYTKNIIENVIYFRHHRRYACPSLTTFLTLI